jgi:hypothetical protein
MCPDLNKLRVEQACERRIWDDAWIGDNLEDCEGVTRATLTSFYALCNPARQLLRHCVRKIREIKFGAHKEDTISCCPNKSLMVDS